MKTVRNIFLTLSVLLLMQGSCLALTTEDSMVEYKYVITLATSSQPIKVTPFAQAGLRQYLLYTTRQQIGEKSLYQLRLGFFKTEDDARIIYKMVEHDYLQVNIEAVSSADLPWIEQWLGSPRPAASEKIVPAENQNLPYKELMQLANEALQKNNLALAIGLYTRIIESPPNAYQQAAQENLGIAREKNNQLAHAMAEYRLYLKTWPTGEGATRVKARLEHLVNQQLTAFFMPGSSKAAPAKTGWLHYGQLYQFYYKDEIELENSNISSEQSFITTSFNYTTRTTGPAAPMEANVAFTHVYDTENSADNKERLTSLYFDMSSDNRVFDMRAGRQKNKTTSLFNRYDGIDLGYMLNADYKARLTYGHPVEFYDTVDDATDKYFYAVGVELFPNHKTWHSSAFYLEQQADDIRDRQEIILDTKYLKQDLAIFSSLDYSLQYETVNLFIASFNRHFSDDSTLNLLADYRKTPFLTTTNALQGQVGVSSLTDLLSTLTEDEIEQLSLDRTATYKSFSAYYAKPLTADLQLTADATVSNTSGTVASQGVAAVADTGNEYSYALGFIRKHYFMKNDQNIVNLRFSELAESDVVLLNLSSELRLEQAWRLNPKLRYDTRDYSDGRSSTAVRPAFGIKNRLNKYWQFEFELAYEDKETDIPNSVSETETDTLLYAGYILSF